MSLALRGSVRIDSGGKLTSPSTNVSAANSRELERLLRQPPLNVSLRALMTALQALEGAGGAKTATHKALLAKGLAKYEYAERAQRKARVKQQTAVLEQLLQHCRELDGYFTLDLDALRAALSSLASDAPEESALIEQGEAALLESQRVKEEMRAAKKRAAIAELERCMSLPPPLLENALIEAAVAAAKVQAHARLLIFLPIRCICQSSLTVLSH